MQYLPRSMLAACVTGVVLSSHVAGSAESMAASTCNIADFGAVPGRDEVRKNDLNK